MASAFSHAVVAVSLGSAILPRRSVARAWLLGIACSVIPDLDVIGFWRGIPYEHLLGHRGLTHSIALDRKSTRLNSSHANNSYAVFCLKKKTTGAASRSGCTLHGHVSGMNPRGSS